MTCGTPPPSTVFVCKDPPDKQHFMVEALHPAAHRLLIRQFQLTDPHIASFILVFFGQCHQAVVLQGADEVFAFLEDELEVLLSGKPAVGQDIAELDGVRHAGGDHRTHQFVLAELRRPLDLAGFHVAELMRFAHHFEGDRNRHVPAVAQRVQQVDAFDRKAFAVVIVPTHDLVFVGAGLFLDCVVEDQARVILLDLAHGAFDINPQVF